MKKVFLAVIALFAFGAASAQTIDDVTTKFNEAATAMNGKDFVAAAAAFNDVITTGETVEGVEQMVGQAKTYLPICYFQQGLINAQAQKFDEAIENMNKAVEVGEMYKSNPKIVQNAKMMVARIYTIQGGTAFNNGDYATAATVFAKGYAANPNDTKLALNLAKCYYEQGKMDEGVKIYKGIMAINHSSVEDDQQQAVTDLNFYFQKALVELQEAGNTDGIIAMAEEWVSADTTNALAAKTLIQQYGAAKKYDEVIAKAESAAALQTDEIAKSDIYLALGAAYNAKEQREQAIAALQKVTEGPSAEIAKQTIAALNKK